MFSEQGFWNMVSYLIFSFPILVLSPILFKIRNEVFSLWFSFVKWWIPLSLLAIAMAPEEIEGFISVPVKLPLAVFLAGVFLILSLILFSIKLFLLRKRKRK